MEANTMPKKPSKVTAAVIMLYISLAIGVMRLFVTWMLFGAPSWIAYTMLTKLLIIIPIATWLYYMVGRGRNWARMTVLILVLIETPLSILAVVKHGVFPMSSLSDFMTNLEIVQTLIKIMAMPLLFQRDSSVWFKAMKNFQTLPFRADEETTIEDGPGLRSVENLVAQLKTELTEGTAQGTLIRTLIKNGWDRKEASQFVKQIAYELTTNPADVQLVINRYKKFLLCGGAITIVGIIALLSRVPRLEMWGHYLLIGSFFAVWGLVGYLVYRGRLAPRNQIEVNRAVTFRPSKGSLQFTKKSMSLVLRIGIAFLAAFGLFILMLVIVSHIKGLPH
jgi:hypothetical protein